MAQYKYRDSLVQSSSTVFDTRHAPGTTPQNPGIYRCPGCADEVTVPKGRQLPPRDHHQHTPSQGKIEWQLLVFAESRK